VEELGGILTSLSTAERGEGDANNQHGRGKKRICKIENKEVGRLTKTRNVGGKRGVEREKQLFFRVGGRVSFTKIDQRGAGGKTKPDSPQEKGKANKTRAVGYFVKGAKIRVYLVKGNEEN